MDLLYQKRLAARILKCGINRVYFDPGRLEDISEAVTRADIKVLINSGAIMSRQKAGISTGRKHYLEAQKAKGRRTGQGSRKGTRYARLTRKDMWINIIRPIRKKLAELRKEGQLTRAQYREIYMHAKGGMFKDCQHMLEHLRTSKILKGGKVKAVKKVVKVTKPAGEVKKTVKKKEETGTTAGTTTTGEVPKGVEGKGDEKTAKKAVVKKVRKPKKTDMAKPVKESGKEAGSKAETKTPVKTEKKEASK